jgi:hypothetical protein
MILKAELEMVMNEFAPLVSEYKLNMKQPHELTPEAMWDLLDKLVPYLKSGNPECLNFIHDLRAVKDSEALIQQVEDFDFELALLTLEKLKDGLS